MNRMMLAPVPTANTRTAALPTNKCVALADNTKAILADQRESNECIQFEQERTWLVMRELELVEESKRKVEELAEETKRREAERKHEMAMLEKRLEYKLCIKQLLAGTAPQTSSPWDSFSLIQSLTDPFSGIPNLDEYK
ncbi:hypothetical protein M422DRAFT_247180 [Sphaerobolus stellatus SS14]|nr:hypothetical protein M422DRAFT_247180 [Sphaerobolus stellatus SS14]